MKYFFSMIIFSIASIFLNIAYCQYQFEQDEKKYNLSFINSGEGKICIDGTIYNFEDTKNLKFDSGRIIELRAIPDNAFLNCIFNGLKLNHNPFQVTMDNDKEVILDFEKNVRWQAKIHAKSNNDSSDIIIGIGGNSESKINYSSESNHETIILLTDRNLNYTFNEYIKPEGLDGYSWYLKFSLNSKNKPIDITWNKDEFGPGEYIISKGEIFRSNNKKIDMMRNETLTVSNCDPKNCYYEIHYRPITTEEYKYEIEKQSNSQYEYQLKSVTNSKGLPAGEIIIPYTALNNQNNIFQILIDSNLKTTCNEEGGKKTLLYSNSSLTTIVPELYQSAYNYDTNKDLKFRFYTIFNKPKIIKLKYQKGDRSEYICWSITPENTMHFTLKLVASQNEYPEKIKISWNSIIGAKEYIIYRNSKDELSSAKEVASITNTCYYYDTVPEQKVYFYWIKVIYNNNKTKDSPSVIGYTSKFLLSISPKIIFPPDKEINVSLCTSLQWQIDNESEIKYNVYLGDNQNPNLIHQNYSSNTLYLPYLKKNTEYFWIIEAVNKNGIKAKSKKHSFTIGNDYTFSYDTSSSSNCSSLQIIKDTYINNGGYENFGCPFVKKSLCNDICYRSSNLDKQICAYDFVNLKNIKKTIFLLDKSAVVLEGCVRDLWKIYESSYLLSDSNEYIIQGHDVVQIFQNNIDLLFDELNFNLVKTFAEEYICNIQETAPVIFSPEKNSQWEIGHEMQIEWDDDYFSDDITLYIKHNGKDIFNDTTENDGRYQWIIPNLVKESEKSDFYNYTLFLEQTNDSSKHAQIVITIKIGRPYIYARSPVKPEVVKWEWRSGGGLGRYRYNIDDDNLEENGKIMVCHEGCKYEPSSQLKEGEHTLYIQEEQTGGQWSQRNSYIIEIDNIKPDSEITLLSFENERSLTINIDYKCEDNNLSKVDLYIKEPGKDKYYLYASDVDNKIDEKFNYFVNMPGKYFFYTLAYDKADNKQDNETTIVKEILYKPSLSGYAIIIVGSQQSVDGKIPQGYESHRATSTIIKNYLKNRSFEEEDIEIIINPQSDLKDDISNWANKKINTQSAPLYIILIGHGEKGYFRLNGSDILTPEDLNTILNDIEDNSKLKHPIVTVIGSCFSGSFKEKLSHENRIIITSSGENEKSKIDILEPDGISVDTFITSLFNELGKGQNLNKSFQKSSFFTRLNTDKGKTLNYFPYFNSWQHPMLNDTNNLADRLCFKYSNTPDNQSQPDFSSIGTDNEFIQQGDRYSTIWANVINLNKIDKVWIEVKKPHKKNDLNLNLIKQELQYDNENKRYQVDCDKFDNPGRYMIFFYLKEKDTGIISTSKEPCLFLFKSKTEKNNNPGSFALLSPENNAQNMPTTILFEWEASRDDDEDDSIIYYLFLSKDKKFSYENTIIKKGLYIKKCSIELPYDSWNNSIIYWKVQAIDNFGAITEISEDNIRIFHTENSSTDNTVHIEGRVWNVNDDTEIPGARLYKIQKDGREDIEICEGGYFKTPLPEGIYDFIATATNFSKKEYLNYPIKNDIIDFNFPLTLDKKIVHNKRMLNIITALKIIAGACVESNCGADSQLDMNKDAKIDLQDALNILKMINKL